MLDETLLRPLVWMDYRLAILFMVSLPLMLLIWAFVKKSEAMQHLMVIYWRVASLLMITVYLMIGGLKVGFLAGWFARILIPIGLWFWVDLNEEIEDQGQTPLKLTFAAWRWGATVYSILGAIVQLVFLNCAFSNTATANVSCQIWREPPLLYKEFFHAGPANSLGFIGVMGLILYVLYLGYFVFLRLGKQGRSATSN